jgi:two-component system chemotaxis sensor kinase CheA
VLDGASALGGFPPVEADHAVIVRGQDRRLALAVTRLVGQRELVTRPLPSGIADAAAVSGGAVLSDGRIALIVDCDAVDPSGAGAAPRIAA